MIEALRALVACFAEFYLSVMDSNFSYKARVSAKTIEEARAKVEAALVPMGFGILTEIDVAKTFRQKLEIEFGPFMILGACSPKLAHTALSADPEIGLLLPCNIVLRQEGDTFEAIFVAPKAMFQLANNESLHSIAKEADGKLRAAVAALS